MIKYIYIENFKSIKRIGIPLENLTLLFGMNGMGKSSVIQSILLCRQSFWDNGNEDMGTLIINGNLIELGTADDIFCSNAENDILRFHFDYTDNPSLDFRYSFDETDIHENYMDAMDSIDITEEYYSMFGYDFTYLSAEHLGPRRKYDYSKWIDRRLNKIGAHGEYAVPFLAMNGDSFKVPKELCLDTGRTYGLIDQVSAWMDKISPGVKLSAELISKDQEARLNISYAERRFMSKSYTPVNVGFGVPYVLPVIITLLTATDASLILIENPESHLHPKGQTAMAELISRAAAYGAQIICESHSDHIINGVRVAVKEKAINKRDVSVVYFSKDSDMNTIGTNISIDDEGNLDDYPDGLLDEWGDLMSKLI